MERFFKRCISLISVAFLLFDMITCASAEQLIDKRKGTLWNMVYIYPEEEKVIPNIVIIYLHGDGNNGGNELDALDVLGKVDHPLKYSKKGTLMLTDDTIVICPQSHKNAEFRNQQDDLKALISDVRNEFPESIIILAGHSNGAIAAYKVAISENEDVNGYVFISGNKPVESEQLQFISNAFVAYGKNDNVNRRGAFSSLYAKHNLNDKEYAEECTFVEEETHSAYMVGSWNHGASPQVLLEEFFWEWVYGFYYQY